MEKNGNSLNSGSQLSGGGVGQPSLRAESFMDRIFALNSHYLPKSSIGEYTAICIIIL